jgi:Ca2+-binding RTX toxin-like protein
VVSKRATLILVALAAAAFPAAAHGGTAGLSYASGEDVIFSADPGEANRLTVTGIGAQGVVLEDAAAPIRPGRGCTALAPNRVQCARTTFVIVRGEDGDDQLTTAGDFGDQTYVFLDGDQGSDTIRGEAGANTIDGGTGTDRLIGGPRTNTIRAVDIVRRGDFSALPDHNRERDDVTCAPRAGDASLGSPPSIEIDTNDAVDGPCPPRYLYLETLIALEGTEGEDTLLSAGPPTRVNGLGGNDFLSGEQNDRLDGGSGDDRLAGQGLLLGGTGNDRVDGGTSFAPRGGVREDGQSGDDTVLGSGAGDSLAGGSGTDVLSGRAGNDSIRIRDGVRDRVTCGSGRDRVSADRSDNVARDCEVVSRG